MAVKTYPKGSKEKLSENFCAYEFDCNGKGCCTETKIDPLLITYLQKIRDHFGKPVKIASGFRCATHNGNISNASKKSKHMEGLAADIKVEGIAPAEVAKYAESIGIKGIGLYEGKDGSFVHVDTRTKKSFWYGHAQAYRSTFGGASSNTTTAEKADSVASYGLTDFIKEVQSACGAAVDGIAGAETISKTPTLSSKKNTRHGAVKAVQKRLYALGYVEVGKADGIAGMKFTSAVAHFQQDHGCVVDGVITAKNKTWRELLGME